MLTRCDDAFFMLRKLVAKQLPFGSAVKHPAAEDFSEAAPVEVQYRRRGADNRQFPHN